ncbi:MAG: flagellar FliJ family protein [Alphaproteobacteria bacterium]|nr:flagellar FliJ family protein [Alphaproteobacteria bacterium]
MKSRDTLLKLYKFRVDEAKTRLHGFEQMRADMTRKIVELEGHLSEESRRATENEIGRFAYPSFAKSIRERKDKLNASVLEVERSIAEARIALHEAFQDLKKLELAEESRQRRESEHLAHVERTDADERSIQRYIRAQAGERR